MEAQPSSGSSRLMEISSCLEAAVDLAGGFTVTVYGRRRLPGSGIVWSQDGLIVTANHVVERSDDVSIGLPDGRRLPVTVRGRNLETDVALLQVSEREEGELKAPAGSAVEARPGTLVLAIGRPGGSGVMASFGMVQAVGSSPADVPSPDKHRFLSAGVAMLPGFSGGPLVDVHGHILGLNSSLLGGSGGLTVANHLLEETVASLSQYGRVPRGYIGIAAQSVELPQRMVEQHALVQERGLLIFAAEPGGPADQAGILLGDVLLSVDGRSLADIDHLQSLLAANRAGSSLVTRLLRAGALVETQVVIGERP
jgi:serine protease Do